MSVARLSPANATDLVYYGHVGEVIDRGDYVVVRTPREPTSYLGNQIIVRRDVAPEDIGAWLSVFRDEFSDLTTVRHVTLNLEGAVDPRCVECAGQSELKLVENAVLRVARPFPPTRERSDIDVRAIADERDWRFVIEGQLERFGSANAAALAYYERHFENQRALIRHGSAAWFCAVLQSQTAASLGLLRCGDMVRFQAIRTDPRFRRRGVARHLMTMALALARIAFGATQAIVVTQEVHQEAMALYDKLGFRRFGNQSFLRTW